MRLEFKNIGKLPKIAMGHNLVILKKGISSLKFGQKAMSMGANATNPLPEASMGDVIAATKLLGPGETETNLHRTIRVITSSFVLSQDTLLLCEELWWLSDLLIRSVIRQKTLEFSFCPEGVTRFVCF